MKSFDQTLSADCGIPPRVDALPNVEIFGIKVHGPTLEQALAIIENWIEQPDGRCRQAIVTGFHGLWVAYEIPNIANCSIERTYSVPTASLRSGFPVCTGAPCLSARRARR